ncbi:cold-responsive protein kinase 1-like [Cryptomeria japonica]|uniref:cold-responsive protein kinase 1-like n=1 Tax=Cryptomeria japonica TaxID=3369 RepID=UPI0027DA6B54|nr:cold-responsive protein kinase 1-like [Cryptomeria japonica]
MYLAAAASYKDHPVVASHSRLQWPAPAFGDLNSRPTAPVYLAPPPTRTSGTAQSPPGTMRSPVSCRDPATLHMRRPPYALPECHVTAPRHLYGSTIICPVSSPYSTDAQSAGRQSSPDIEGATELRGPEDFDFKILKKATNDFDQANKLGEGGFGEVFKGTLKSGKVVAVKKLTLGHSARAISEFESEVRLISNVHHRNLVRLVGCCRQGQERLLIYEYMPNTSLDRILFGKNKRLLSWKERFNIILGTARGLAYLHEEFHVCIIHRDIKSSNILLDNNFQAKIADFGLARLLPNDKTHVSTRFAGTLGYTAPEYANRGQLTEKADTYSFGVVVLEIVSGRKTIDLKQPPHMQYLLQWVWSLYEDNKVLEVVECEKEMEGYSEEEVLRVINLALLCIQASIRQRPSMSEVVTILLSNDEIEFQKLLQPSFVDMGNKANGQCSNSGTSSSQPNATITESLNAL